VAELKQQYVLRGSRIAAGLPGQDAQQGPAVHVAVRLGRFARVV